MDFSNRYDFESHMNTVFAAARRAWWEIHKRMANGGQSSAFKAYYS